MLGTILGTGINLVANGIGSWLANKRQKKANEALDAHYDNRIGELNREINSNYLDRADAQNALRKVTDSNNETLRQLNTGAIRGGATDEAKVAMASQLNKRTADVVGDLAAIGEQRKDALRQERRGVQDSYATTKYKRLSDTSGINTLLSSIGTAAQSLGSSLTKSGTPTEDTTATDATAATTSAVTPPQPTEPVMMTKNGNSVGAPEDNQVVYGQGPITDTMEEEGYRTKNGKAW